MRRYATNLEGVESRAQIPAGPSSLFPFCMCYFCCRSRWQIKASKRFVSGAPPGPTPRFSFQIPTVVLLGFLCWVLSHSVQLSDLFLSLHVSPPSPVVTPQSAIAQKLPTPGLTFISCSLSGVLSACQSASGAQRHKPPCFQTPHRIDQCLFSFPSVPEEEAAFPILPKPVNSLFLFL